ncbi:MAG: type II toxin-antitoxin system PemK/MazF family toxin [Armatimonadetes bacterium]|nr:type II toxin-antitoxin system PemK/MazF family toxin [Armatimonadota bacterium]
MTPEDSFEAGAIYFADPAIVHLTCPKCGHEAAYRIARARTQCLRCHETLQADAQQVNWRPYVILGSKLVREWDNTVLAVPLTTAPAASARPNALEIIATPDNGLDTTSWALPTKLRTLNKTSIFKEQRRGTLSREDLRQLREAVTAALFDEEADDA